MMVRTKYSVSMNIATIVHFVYEVTKILHNGIKLCYPQLRQAQAQNLTFECTDSHHVCIVM